MKMLYFDCFSGISGDMCLGALLDLGVPFEYLLKEIEKLGVTNYEIKLSKTDKNGITANYVEVIVPKEEHNHRHHSEIIEIIDKSAITDRAKQISKGIFEKIAVAEAKVHGVSVSDVAFHEVGAMDSIIDIIGVGVCVDFLGVQAVHSSVVNDGFGFANCQHGKIPVPVPAVVEIFSASRVKSRQIDVEGELVTPTGAGIVAHLAQNCGVMPEMNVLKTGYGAGRKNFDIPNVLRIMLGEIGANEGSFETDNVFILETNIDDSTPEILAYTCELLLENGAKDVFSQAIFMKKGRIGTKLSVICNEKTKPALEEIIFRETSTIGIRSRKESRKMLKRTNKTKQTKHGELSVKILELQGVTTETPEFESAKMLAKKINVPLKEIYSNN